MCGGCDSLSKSSGCYVAGRKNDKFQDLKLTFDARELSAQFNIIKDTCGAASVLKLRCGTNTEADVGKVVYEGFIAPQLTYPKAPAKNDANPRQTTSPAIICEEDSSFITCPAGQVGNRLAI